MERAVQLSYLGRLYTFRVEPEPPLAFWRVEVEGESYRLPLRVNGGEGRRFVETIAKGIAEGWRP